MNLLTYLTYLLLQTAPATWQPYKTTPQVDVFYRTEQCHDEVNGIHREYILLKFVNKTDENLVVLWNLESYSNNVCSTCGSDEYKYSLKLDAHQTLEGECSSEPHKLKVFVKHLDLPNHSTFTKFELGNLRTVPYRGPSPNQSW